MDMLLIYMGLCAAWGEAVFLPAGTYVVLVGGSHTTIQLQKLIKDRVFFEMN